MLVWVGTAPGALYIALEHRFYGVSMPARDYSTASLALLSSRQAYVYAPAPRHCRARTTRNALG